MFTSGRVGPSVIFRGIHCVSFVGPDIMIGWSSRDVFLMRSTIFFSNRRVVGTVSLKEMLRNEGSSFFIPSVVREVHAGRKALIG